MKKKIVIKKAQGGDTLSTKKTSKFYSLPGKQEIVKKNKFTVKEDDGRVVKGVEKKHYDYDMKPTFTTKSTKVVKKNGGSMGKCKSGCN